MPTELDTNVMVVLIHHQHDFLCKAVSVCPLERLTVLWDMLTYWISRGSCLCQIYASSGELEVPGFLEGDRSRDMVEPLTKDEFPPFNIWLWLKW